MSQMLLIFTLLAFIISIYACGRLMVRYLYGDTIISFSYTLSVGLVVWAFFGGILNVLHMAIPFFLYSMIGFSISLVLFQLINRYKDINRNLLVDTFMVFTSRFTSLQHKPLVVLPVVLLTATTLFLVIMIMPTGAFNIQDDFQTYFVRVIRMLQVGMMGGNNISMLGIDSLGVQSFFQAFFQLVLPLGFINGFDLVFCFFLSGLLINDIGLKLKVHWVYRFISILLFIFINPRIVNISAHYSGSVAILALIYSSMMFLERQKFSNRISGIKSAIPIGLFAALAVALKVTFIPFVAIYLILFFLSCLTVLQNRRQVLISAIYAVLAAIVFVVPWVIVSIDAYLSLLSYVFKNMGAATITPGGDGGASVFTSYQAFLSTKLIGTGGTYLDTTFNIAVMVFTGVISVFICNGIAGARKHLHLVVLISICTSVLVSFLIMPLFITVPTWLIRYFSPVLIATLPAVMVIISSHFPSPGKLFSYRVSSIWITTLLLLQVMVLYLHLNLLLARYEHAVTSHSLLAFHFLGNEKKSGAYVSLNKRALSDSSHKIVVHTQSMTQKGETILAWVLHPFYFDFRRNNILTVDPGGLGFTELPLTEGPEKLRDYLLSLGVDYVLWQYRGPGVRNSNMLRGMIQQVGDVEGQYIKPELYMRLVLESLGHRSKIIMNSGRTVLFDIRKS